MGTKRNGFAWLALAALLLAAPIGIADAHAQPGSGLPGPSLGSAPAGSVPPAGGVLPPAAMTVPGAGVDDNYRLGTGDKLKVTVYGETDLSGEFTVDGSGQVQLPLLGQVPAANLTVHQFVDTVQKALGEKYLRDPRVSVQIENYRPFYIMGEVNKPGEYPYENGLSALGAIALAGGFTYRADQSDVYVRRHGEGKEQVLPATGATAIGPGDVVRVSERIF